MIGSYCLVTNEDEKSLFCGGLFKFRVLDEEKLSPYLLLGLFNSFIVKRQIRTKQFTRDVIDTIGKRVDEAVLPIPRSKKLRNELSERIKFSLYERINGRKKITELSEEILD